MEIFKSREEFSKWIDLFRKKGVQSLKMGEFEINLSPDALLPESEYKRKKREKDLPIAQPQMTEEQVLLWSADPSATFAGETH